MQEGAIQGQGPELGFTKHRALVSDLGMAPPHLLLGRTPV